MATPWMHFAAYTMYMFEVTRAILMVNSVMPFYLLIYLFV